MIERGLASTLRMPSIEMTSGDDALTRAPDLAAWRWSVSSRRKDGEAHRLRFATRAGCPGIEVPFDRVSAHVAGRTWPPQGAHRVPLNAIADKNVIFWSA
jgi:hypothetical protein